MRLTRDSILWWLVLSGAICGYLATMPQPMAWTWAQWMQTGAAVAAIIGAKLSNSPLRGENDPPKDGIGSKVAGIPPTV